MKDLTNSTWANLSNKARQTFSNIQNNVSNTEKNMKFMRNSIDELRNKLQEVNKIRFGTVLASEFKAATREAKELEREISRLENKGKSGGGLLGKIAPYLGAAALASGAFSFGKASLSQYMDFEKSSKSYQVLAGNKAIGGALSGDLNNLKQNSILGTAVYPNSQMLMAFGDRADKVIPHLKMLGDVSMGDQDKLHRLAYAFGEVESAGRLTGRQVMQMTNAGFNPLREISKNTGESIEALREKMRKGQITFKQVEHAFETATAKGGMFHNMMNEMSETTAGKALMLKGRIAALQIAVGERLAPAFKSATNAAIKMVDWFKHLIEIPIEQKLTDEIAKIRGLQAELTASNTSRQRQLEILKELEQINPNIVAGINAQNIEYNKLAENINNVTDALQKKIFLEKFNKSNADTLTSYSEAQEKYNTNYGQSLAIIGSVFPDLAQDTKLTLGQKQVEAQRRLAARVQRDPHKGFVEKFESVPAGGGMMIKQEMTDDLSNLNILRRTIQDANNAMDVINSLQPKVNQINKTKDALTQQIEKYTGVKSMVATDIQNNPGAYKGAGGEGDESGKEVSSGITSGGPRVININGVKFTDKIEIHAATMQEGTQELESHLEEMFLRILNSGAAVQ